MRGTANGRRIMAGILVAALAIPAAPALAAKSKPSSNADSGSHAIHAPVMRSGSLNAVSSSRNKQAALQAGGYSSTKNTKSNKVRYASYSSGSGYGGYSSGLSCVPYARNVTGMNIAGNATNWWSNAAGSYARGAAPETGSVLNFRSTGRMPLGHVAVVTGTVNNREIIVDHSNWVGHNVVSRGVPVIDVSDNNDWSRVRVGLPHSGGDFGSTYPTYGFIYNRSDSGSMLAARSSGGGVSTAAFEEVAEARRPVAMDAARNN